MFEDIQKHRQAVRENIEKSLQIGYTEGEDFEKAHNVGDIHPNGKWVWTQLPSGKFDWRVRKQGGSSAPAASSGSSQKVKFTSSDFKIVPDTYLKYGNRSKKDFEGLYQTAYDSYKNMSDQDLWDKREKVINTYQNAVVMYRSMIRTASATQLNKQGNDVDKLAAEVYILNHLLGEKSKRENNKGGSPTLGEYYSATLRGPKDVEEFFSDIRKKKISLDVFGMKRADGTYDRGGKITGGKLGSQYDSYAVQVNIHWYGNSSNEKRQFASIADFKKFLVSVG